MRYQDIVTPMRKLIESIDRVEEPSPEELEYLLEITQEIMSNFRSTKQGRQATVVDRPYRNGNGFDFSLRNFGGTGFIIDPYNSDKPIDEVIDSICKNEQARYPGILIEWTWEEKDWLRISVRKSPGAKLAIPPKEEPTISMREIAHDICMAFKNHRLGKTVPPRGIYYPTSVNGTDVYKMSFNSWGKWEQDPSGGRLDVLSATSAKAAIQLAKKLEKQYDVKITITSSADRHLMINVGTSAPIRARGGYGRDIY